MKWIKPGLRGRLYIWSLGMMAGMSLDVLLDWVPTLVIDRAILGSLVAIALMVVALISGWGEEKP